MSEANATESAPGPGVPVERSKTRGRNFKRPDSAGTAGQPQRFKQGTAGAADAGITQNNSSLGLTVSNLAKLKLIDPALLSKCQNAGQCQKSGRTGGLFVHLYERLQRARRMPVVGQRRAGRRQDRTDDVGQRYFGKRCEISGTHAAAEPHLFGRADGGPEQGRAPIGRRRHHRPTRRARQRRCQRRFAHAQVILPEHRQAVQNFFKRDEK